MHLVSIDVRELIRPRVRTLAEGWQGRGNTVSTLFFPIANAKISSYFSTLEGMDSTSHIISLLIFTLASDIDFNPTLLNNSPIYTLFFPFRIEPYTDGRSWARRPGLERHRGVREGEDLTDEEEEEI